MPAQESKTIAEFRARAIECIERVELGWELLLGSPNDPERASDLHRDLLGLKSDARAIGLTDVNLVIAKVEELVLLAHRRQYRVPDDFTLLVTMGLGFAQTLLQKKAGAGGFRIDLEGLLRQLDQALAELAASGLQRSTPGSVGRPLEFEQLPWADAARRGLCRLSATLLLETLRAPESMRGRIRAAFEDAQRTLELGAEIPLAPMLREIREMASRREWSAAVRVVTDCDESIRVSAEALQAARTVIACTLDNAVQHAVDSEAERSKANKPDHLTVRIAATAFGTHQVSLTITDDGRGILLRDAKALGRVPPGVADGQPIPIDVATGASGGGIQRARAAVDDVGGRTTVRTQMGRGTSVTCEFPRGGSSHAVVHVFGGNSGPQLALLADWTCEPVPTPNAPEECALGVLTEEPLRKFRVTRDGMVADLVLPAARQRAIAQRPFRTDETEPLEVIALRGAHVVLVRPEQLEDALLKRDPTHGVTSTKGGNQRILIVDNSETWLVLTRAALLYRGFDVRVASNVREFQTAVFNWTPHAVLCAAEGDGIKGSELFRALRQRTEWDHVIMLLFAEQEIPILAKLATAAGADGFVAKNAGPNRIHALLASLLAQQDLPMVSKTPSSKKAKSAPSSGAAG